MTKARDIASAAPAPSTVSATELGYLDGVTSAIQTQINTKQATVSGVDDTEIGYLNGVTSAIQTQLDAKTAKSTLTTTGDIYYASAANTPARLGIGSTDQVLKVSGGVPVWATPAAGGGMTLLSTTTMSGAVTTISSISGSYKQLYVIWYGMTNATGSGYMEMKFNNTGNYSGNKSIGSSGSPTSQAENNVSIVRISYGTTNNTNANNFAAMTINDYASTSNRKTFTISYSYSTSEIIDYTGAFLNNAAISELNFSNTGGDWTAGTVKIYGVN